MSIEEPTQFIERILRESVKVGASDIYFIPTGDALVIRRRTDGVQSDVDSVPGEFGERCISRLKVLAGLLTYRTRVSQDGAIHETEGPGGTELRVSVMPTSHGERASVRILQGSGTPQLLGELNLGSTVVDTIRELLKAPTGMIVLTGPTGSGKTTTIYSLIYELLREHQDPASIITIEDPIECEIEGISQVSIANEPGWGYAPALKAALRQDVKTLVIGEMRDMEVVGVTLDAALSGHRVITTYHAGDIPSVYARLLHHGFEPFLIASAITGVISQRLVERADGNGRIPVVAVMQPDDAWRDLVGSNPGLSELRRRIQDYSDADLQAVADAMAETGQIPQGITL